MSCKVYVGGLPWACNADELKEVCSKFGAIEDAFIVMDKTAETPRSKGFGFVTFQDANQAAECQKNLNGSKYGGRILKVGAAHKETEGGGNRGRGYSAAGGSRYPGASYGDSYDGSRGYGQGAGYGGYGSGGNGYSSGVDGSYGGGGYMGTAAYSDVSYGNNYSTMGRYSQDTSHGGLSGGYSGNDQYSSSNQYQRSGYGNYGNGYSYDTSGY